MGAIADRRVRADIKGIMVAALIVFSGAMAIPMANALLTVAGAVEGGAWFTNPNLLMDATFFVCIEGALLAFMVFMAHGLISRDRRWMAARKGV